MSIEQTLQTLIGQGLAELFSMPTPPEAVPLQATRKDFEGSHTFVTFPVAKQLRRNPAEVGQQIGEYLQQHDADVVARFNVVQGFLNLTLADTVWMRLFGDMAAAADYGTQPANGRRVMVEYSSPNTNKPLHLGHLRNNFLGYAIAEILEANGCEVMKTNIVNDRGIHICKSMLAYQKFGNGETPESSGMKGDHLVGKYYVEFDKRYKEQINEIYSFWKSQSISDFKIPGNVEDYFREKIAVIIGIILSSSEESYKEDAVKIYDIAIAGLVSLKNQVSNNIERTNVVDGIIEKVQGKRNELLIIQAQQMLVKWEQGDPETVALWKKMNSWVYAGFDVTYKRMGVDFDKFYYESETYLLGKEIVAEGLEKGVFFKKDNGSVWVDLTADGLDEKLLLRGDGTSVYITQDLGLADLKHHDFPMNQSVYVVGNEQDYHFKVLFSVLRKLNRPYADGLHHLSYGMVDLPSGRMKSREGTVVDADDLMQEMVDTAKARSMELSKVAEFPEEEQRQLFEMLGLGALKYFLLKVDPVKRMLFNPDESIDLQGNTATFIQFNHARIRSILRKAKESGVSPVYEVAEPLHETEVNLVKLFAEFPAKIKEAADNYAPSVIANYVYEVAKEYSRFFTECSIFQADTPERMRFRVALSAGTGRVIKKGMKLLGIDVPERM